MNKEEEKTPNDLDYEEMSDTQRVHFRKKTREQKDIFIRMVNHNYNEDLVEKHIGDEKRTFSIMKPNIPLLSPSRCLKWLNEHIWWSIPSKNLAKPRLFGQLVHLQIEWYYKMGEYVVFNESNIVDWLKGDIVVWENWSNELRKKFINDLNTAIPKIIDVLKENMITILASEKHIANDTFHGFVDLLGLKSYKGTGMKTPILIDLKTTTQPTIKPEHILQLAIYKKIMRDIPKTYILFYDTNTQKCTLEQIFQKKINNHYNKVKSVIDLFR